MSARPILKQGRKYEVRILRPSEYEILSKSFRAPDLLDGGLATGMRYVELQRLQGNPSWYDGDRFVYLPREASKKEMGVRITKEGEKVRRPRSQLNRFVKLSDWGKAAMPAFLKGRTLPTWESWTIWLREDAAKAGLDPVGLGPKTTRKTWESWATKFYGQTRILEIVQSQGHTTATSLGHYLSMPFLPVDVEAMRPYVEGMF